MSSRMTASGGATLDRPALDRLRDAVAQGEVEAVLILSPDRLARQFAYQFIVVEEFERAGCEVVFSSHGFGSSPADRMLVEMTGVFAEYERALITERCRRGRLYRARHGQLWMKEAPYGYTYLPKTDTAPSRLLINEAEAEVIRLIFRWLIDEQLSTYQINKRLNESGIRTRRGRERWAGGYIINLLRNPVYAGTYYYNRRQHRPAVRKNMPKDEPRKHPQHSSQSWRPPQEWIGVSVPAIIDQETWEMARRQLQLNKERAPRNNKKHDYLLKGLLVCGDCQLRMLGHAGDPKTRRRRYLCSRKETLHLGSDRCPNRTVLAEMIEDLVWESVSDLLRNPELLTAQYRAQQGGEGTPEQHERRRLERRQAALEGEGERLLDAYQSGVIELSDLKGRRERIREERARARRTADRAQATAV